MKRHPHPCRHTNVCLCVRDVCGIVRSELWSHDTWVGTKVDFSTVVSCRSCVFALQRRWYRRQAVEFETLPLHIPDIIQGMGFLLIYPGNTLDLRTTLKQHSDHSMVYVVCASYADIPIRSNWFSKYILIWVLFLIDLANLKQNNDVSVVPTLILLFI